MTTAVSSHPNTKELRRFFQKIDLVDANGCWIWGSAKSGKGWPVYQSTSAYRFVYEWFVADIPEGHDVDHLCANRQCVNPAHLEAVSRRENVRRMVQRRGWDVACKRGHPRTPENTWRNGNGATCCKACISASQRSRRQIAAITRKGLK